MPIAECTREAGAARDLSARRLGKPVVGYLFAIRGAKAGIPGWIGWAGIVVGLANFAAVFSVGSLFRPFGITSIVGFVSFNVYVAVIAVFMIKDGGQSAK